MPIARLLGISEVPRATLLAKYTYPGSRFVEVMGTQVHVVEEGTGPAVVMIHGFAASLHTWDACAADLKKDHRVIRFDLPPFGLTGPMRDAKGKTLHMTLAIYRRFVNELLGQLNVKDAVVIGNSLGGLLTWDLAVEHPDKVSKIVLSDAVAFPQKMPIYVKLFTYKLLGLLAPYSLPTPVLKMATRDVYGDKKKLSDKTLEQYIDLFMQKANRSGIRKMIHILEDMEYDVARLKKLTCPVLVVWGQEDRWVPISSAHQLVAHCPHATLVTYPGVGHIPMEEAPDRFIQDVRTFIQQ